MTKLDLIKMIIDIDDEVFEELKYAEWDKKFFEKVLLLANKINYLGDTDKIGLIEIDNEGIYIEPRYGYKFTSFDFSGANTDLDETTCFNYRWNIKKGEWR